jgi:hypothetical protein
LPPAVPLVPSVETALRRALGDPSWRVRHAAAHALYAAGVARLEAIVTLHAGPRGVPGSDLRNLFSLDPLPPELLTDLWAIAWQVAGVAAPRAPIVPIEVDEALSRVVQLVWSGHPVPPGFLDALWARVVEPGEVPDRGSVFWFYARLAWWDPASGARLVGLLEHRDENLRAAAFGVFGICMGTHTRRQGLFYLQPPEVFAWIGAGLRDPARRDRAFALLEAMWRRLQIEELRGAAGDRFADTLLAERAEPAPARRAVVIGALAGWVKERADVKAVVVAAYFDDPDPEVRRHAGNGLSRCEDQREWRMRGPRAPNDVRARDIFGDSPDARRLWLQRVDAYGDKRRRFEAGRRRFEALVAEGTSALAERLASPRRNDAARALAAIVHLGEAASPAVPAIVALLDRAESARLRRRAARALGRLGPAALDAATTLIRLLRDPSEAMRAVAALSLGRIGVVGSPP